MHALNHLPTVIGEGSLAQGAGKLLEQRNLAHLRHQPKTAVRSQKSMVEKKKAFNLNHQKEENVEVIKKSGETLQDIFLRSLQQKDANELTKAETQLLKSSSTKTSKASQIKKQDSTRRPTKPNEPNLTVTTQTSFPARREFLNQLEEKIERELSDWLSPPSNSAGTQNRSIRSRGRFTLQKDRSRRSFRRTSVSFSGVQEAEMTSPVSNISFRERRGSLSSDFNSRIDERNSMSSEFQDKDKTIDMVAAEEEEEKEDDSLDILALPTKMDVAQDHLSKMSPKREMFFDLMKLGTAHERDHNQPFSPTSPVHRESTSPLSRRSRQLLEKKKEISNPACEEPISSHEGPSTASIPTIGEDGLFADEFPEFVSISSSSPVAKPPQKAHPPPQVKLSPTEALSFYISSTRKAGIYPEPIVVFKTEEAFKSGEIDLSFLSLGDLKLSEAASATFSSLPIKCLRVPGNRLSDIGAAGLVNKLPFPGHTQCVLDISSNQVGFNTVSAIATRLLLDKSCFLIDLNLSRNKLDFRSAQTLSRALQENHSLRRLDLSYNKLGHKGAQALAEFLNLNSTLNYLELGWTNISTQGGAAIIRALHSNPNNAIVSLDLSNNALGSKAGFNKLLASTGKGQSPDKFEAESFTTALCRWLSSDSGKTDGAKEREDLPNRSSNKMKRITSNSGLLHKTSAESLGGRKVSMSKFGSSHQVLMNDSCSLTHLNLSNNMLDENSCKQLATVLRGNRTLLGLHMLGNCAWVDSIGSVHPTKIFDDQCGDDPSVEISNAIRRLHESSVESLQKILTESWNPKACCWICAGWTQRKFSICAPHLSKVRLHTSFDIPAWSGTPMNESDGFASDHQESMKLNKILLRALELDDSRFNLVEFSSFRVCPPGEVSFFFTVDGFPILSDVELQVPWRRLAAKEYAEPPCILLSTFEFLPPIENQLSYEDSNQEMIPDEEDGNKNFQQLERTNGDNQIQLLVGEEPTDFVMLNVALTLPRQHVVKEIDLRRVSKVVQEDTLHLQSASAWALRRESGLYNYSQIDQVRERLTSHKPSELPNFDPYMIKVDKEGLLFCCDAPPRSVVFDSPLMTVGSAKESALQYPTCKASPTSSFKAARLEAQAQVGKRLSEAIKSKYSKDQVDKVFDQDWEGCDIENFIGSKTERKKTKGILKARYQELTNIFHFYSTLDGEDSDPKSAFSISLNSFLTFCRDTDILPGLFDDEASLLELFELALQAQEKRKTFSSRNSATQKPELVSKTSSVSISKSPVLVRGESGQRVSVSDLELGELPGLCRPKFLELLVRLSITSFSEKEPRESENIAQLLNAYVLPNSKFCSLNGFTLNEDERECLDSTLSRNIPMLLRIYSAHAGAFSQVFEMQWMSLQEWLDVLKKADLLTDKHNLLPEKFRSKLEHQAHQHSNFQGGGQNSLDMRLSSKDDESEDLAIYKLPRRLATIIFTSAVGLCCQDQATCTRFYKMNFLDFLLALAYVSISIQQHSHNQVSELHEAGMVTMEKSPTKKQLEVFSFKDLWRALRLVLRRTFTLTI